MATTYSDAFLIALRFNGKDAAQNGKNFRQVVVPDWIRDDRFAEGQARAAAEIAAFAPHIVVDGSFLDTARAALPQC